MDQAPPEPKPEGSTFRGRITHARARADQLARQAESRFEEERRRRSGVRIGWNAWLADRNRGGGLLAGGLAYRVFLWELPAALFVVGVFSLASTYSDKNPADLARSSGLGAAMVGMVAQAVSLSDASRWGITLIGLSGILWAGKGAGKALELISEIAWQRRAKKRFTVTKSTLGFNVIAFGLAAAIAWYPPFLDRPFVAHVLWWSVVTLSFAAVIVGIMALLPHGGRSWVWVVPGAVFFAITSRIVSIGATIYLSGRIDRTNDVYGGLGVAVVALLWLYLGARFFVWGQFLSATWAGVRPGRLEGADRLGEALDEEWDEGPGVEAEPDRGSDPR
jgi:uncharacterized BrkB/YihY/UPF0761 family membrane protein